MVVIGIDPGLKGGLAAIDSEDMKPVVRRMPVLDGVVDATGLARWMGDDIGEAWGCIPAAIMVMVEKSQPFPKMGVVSAFKFGQAYGAILATCESLDMSYRVVRPQEWKKVILKGYAKGKEASVLYCKRRFPDLKLKKTDDGIADAICIALYGLQESGVR